MQPIQQQRQTIERFPPTRKSDGESGSCRRSEKSPAEENRSDKFRDVMVTNWEALWIDLGGEG
jgi:hypothetical protein